MPHDRRSPAHGITVCRCIHLTLAQQRMLRTSEELGWKLGFVRHALQQPLPVLFANTTDYIVLRADGTIDRMPGIDIRH